MDASAPHNLRHHRRNQRHAHRHPRECLHLPLRVLYVVFGRVESLGGVEPEKEAEAEAGEAGEHYAFSLHVVGRGGARGALGEESRATAVRSSSVASAPTHLVAKSCHVDGDLTGAREELVRR